MQFFQQKKYYYFYENIFKKSYVLCMHTYIRIFSVNKEFENETIINSR